MELPKGIEKILISLEICGYEAYVVGGSVRDALLGRTPKDWDVCTSARPEEVAACMGEGRVLMTGLKYGTVTVRMSDVSCEVTTYRVEAGYADSRHPDEVIYVGDLEADLARRDFTINAMAYHPATGLVDPFSGAADLRAGLIRCVGAPERRFGEDALRILRALRFSAVFGYALEPATADAARRCAPNLKLVSKERAGKELIGLLSGGHAAGVLSAYGDIPAECVEPLRALVADRGAWEKRVRPLVTAPEDLEIRLAILLRGMGTEAAARLLTGFAFGRSVRETTVALLRLADTHPPADESGMKRLLRDCGEEQVRLYLALCRAVFIAEGTALTALERAEGLLERIIGEGQCYSLKSLDIDGGILIEHGVQPGKRVGEVLEHLLERVMNGETENRREALMREVLRFQTVEKGERE